MSLQTGGRRIQDSDRSPSAASKMSPACSSMPASSRPRELHELRRHELAARPRTARQVSRPQMGLRHRAIPSSIPTARNPSRGPNRTRGNSGPMCAITSSTFTSKTLPGTRPRTTRITIGRRRGTEGARHPQDALARGYDAGLSLEPHMVVVFHDAQSKACSDEACARTTSNMAGGWRRWSVRSRRNWPLRRECNCRWRNLNCRFANPLTHFPGTHRAEPDS